MKKLFLLAFLFAAVVPAGAQWAHQPSNENSSRLDHSYSPTRTEIIIPQVSGYNVIKVDLHVHTVYSDGNMSPKYRVREAWMDGLDAIAITDHLEHRPNEKHMRKYFGKDDKETPDFNYSVKRAKNEAKERGITLISGAEITRNPQDVGHFNALFTTDNNLIPDSDPLQAIRNAKKQGALVQSNHPGWRKTDNEFTPVCKAALDEHLIDGVEVFNTGQFYPDAIEKAQKLGLFMSSGTDIHWESPGEYRSQGFFRNMTLLLAKDASEASIREALESKRTLSYSYGDIAGTEQLLKDFFKACVSVKFLYKDSKENYYYLITNHSSLPFYLRYPGSKSVVTLPALSSIRTSETEPGFNFAVANLWYGPDSHPVVEYGL